MKYLLQILCLCALLAGCDISPDKEDIAGGPCSYNIATHPATVVLIRPVDSVYNEILFEVEPGGGAKDTLYFSQSFNHYANQVEIDSLDLVPGKVFSFEEHTIKSGSCNPHFYWLKLAPYTKARE